MVRKLLLAFWFVSWLAWFPACGGEAVAAETADAALGEQGAAAQSAGRFE